jgi:2-keto-4-pentenoate hydratase/2-oxohepta-3-ene-1,7-dioic acid hydratase in catechol pathway
MRLITFDLDGRTEVGVEDGSEVISQAESSKVGRDAFETMLHEPDRYLAVLRQSVARGEGVRTPRATVRLLPAVPRPRKIIAIGRNYPDHALEGGNPPPPEPLVFAKFPSALIADGELITWDPDLTAAVDYEAELAVVVGKRARHVTRDHALSYVLGSCCANDVSARDLQMGDGQWTRGKSLDTFCPLGPTLVTADEVADPQRLAIRCLLNGDIVQEDSTANMLFSVAQIVSYCSQAFTLDPGDVILTGTPAGVGYFRSPRVVLRDGDIVTVEIEGIGRLTNPCRASPRSGARPSGATQFLL